MFGESLLCFVGFLFVLCVLVKFAITFAPFVMREQNLNEKYHGGYAIVTGGTDGIGLAISKKLIAQGFNVNIVGLDTGKISQSELPNGSTLTICDLSDYEATTSLCEWIAQYEPKLLIHGAGLCVPHAFHLIQNPKKYNDAFITSMVALTSAFVKSRRSTGGIVFFSSQVSFFSNPYASLYGATKAYTEQFARALAIENPLLDILVLLPGAVNGTSFFKKFPKYWAFKLIQILGNNVITCSSFVFRCIGRFSSIDFGIYTFITRVIIGVLDSNIVDLASKFITSPLRKHFESQNCE